MLANDIVKQPASAAAIRSPGLVARSIESTLAFSVNGPSKAPLPSPMRPPPSGTVPCQLASDLRVTRTPKFSLLGRKHYAADAVDTRARWVHRSVPVILHRSVPVIPRAPRASTMV